MACEPQSNDKGARLLFDLLQYTKCYSNNSITKTKQMYEGINTTVFNFLESELI